MSNLPQGTLKEEITKIVKNDTFIMNAIVAGTKELGLVLNHNETVQSPDYLNYGKVPVFRG